MHFYKMCKSLFVCKIDCFTHCYATCDKVHLQRNSVMLHCYQEGVLYS